MGCVGLGFGGSLGGGVRSIWVCGYGFRGYNLCWYPMTWEEEEEELNWFFFFFGIKVDLGRRRTRTQLSFFFFFFRICLWLLVCLFVCFVLFFVFFFVSKSICYQSLFAACCGCRCKHKSSFKQLTSKSSPRGKNATLDVIRLKKSSL